MTCSPKYISRLPKNFHGGPRTALACMLRGDWQNGWLAHFGLKCSSWVAVNMGTSGRSICCSIGNTDFKSVRDANCLGSRIFVRHFRYVWFLICVSFCDFQNHFDTVSYIWEYILVKIYYVVYITHFSGWYSSWWWRCVSMQPYVWNSRIQASLNFTHVSVISFACFCNMVVEGLYHDWNLTSPFFIVSAKLQG